ncbi:MAG: hypothetical protein QG616_662 [Pseudomonadota bacterium]|nr:hypothetical protein [Pseudomonadota bacterium]MDQ5942583.1 hypothetical protein [Pseudomonadota bacterium]
MTTSTVTSLPTPAHGSLVDGSDALNDAISMLRFLSMEVVRQRETDHTEKLTAQIDYGEYLIHQHILDRMDDAQGAILAALEQKRVAA